MFTQCTCAKVFFLFCSCTFIIISIAVVCVAAAAAVVALNIVVVVVMIILTIYGICIGGYLYILIQTHAKTKSHIHRQIYFILPSVFSNTGIYSSDIHIILHTYIHTLSYDECKFVYHINRRLLLKMIFWHHKSNLIKVVIMYNNLQCISCCYGLFFYRIFFYVNHFLPCMPACLPDCKINNFIMFSC